MDILSWRNKHGRIHAQIKDICAILSGLLVAADYKKGQALVQGRDFKENQDFFQEVGCLACLSLPGLPGQPGPIITSLLCHCCQVLRHHIMGWCVAVGMSLHAVAHQCIYWIMVCCSISAVRQQAVVSDVVTASLLMLPLRSLLSSDAQSPS